MTTLPDHLPILDRPGARRVRDAVYAEREIVAPVDLCDARGRLNPAAVGFSRQPLVRANLSGHWPRKKKLELLELDRAGLRVLGDARGHRLRVVLRVHADRVR